MSYRRSTDHEEARSWKAWLNENRPDLERIGLPLSVYEEVERWKDFLENGHLHWHDEGAPFDLLDAPRGQMLQVRAFLNGTTRTTHHRYSGGSGFAWTKREGPSV